MADNQRATGVGASNQGFICTDLLVLIAIIILYVYGKDQSCGIEAAQILLIYIIIKASLIGKFFKDIICFLQNYGNSGI